MLTHQGYTIPLANFSLEPRKSLTLQPKTHPDYPLPSVKCFFVKKETVDIPRVYGLHHFGIPSICTQQSHPITLSFAGQLRPLQAEIADIILPYLYEHQTGIVSIFTGAGKTPLALYVSAMMKERTLILCHKTQLLKQWQDEIARFLPDAKVGVIQAEKKQVTSENDIYVGMIQTVMNMEEIPPIFGLVIIDEVHRIAAEHFSRTLFKVNSKFMLGMSATPVRKDGLTTVLNYHLGDIFVRREADKDNRKSEVHFISWKGNYDSPHYSIRINKLCKDLNRTRFIAEKLHEQMTDERKALVVTDRRNHVNTLAEVLQTYGYHVGTFMGQMKQDEIQKALECDIVVATYGVFTEGLSVEKLNTLVLASPKSDVVQLIGRIFRKKHSVTPLILDIVDSDFYGLSIKRKRNYQAQLGEHTRYIYQQSQSSLEADEDYDI